MSVRVDDDRAAQAEAILHDRSGVDAMQRGAAYREQGWDGYSTDAPAYSAAEMARERTRYRGESRSFGTTDPMSDDDRMDDRDRDRLGGSAGTTGDRPLGRSF